MNEEKQIEKIVEFIGNLTFDLRQNMTSVTRYVKHERSKRPNLTEGQFIDQNIKYRELALKAVDNILRCLNENDELSEIERLRFEKEDDCKQSEKTTAVPCVVGDTMFVVSRYYTGKWEVYECKVTSLTIYENLIFVSLLAGGGRNFALNAVEINENIFFTKEEAEKRIERIKAWERKR